VNFASGGHYQLVQDDKGQWSLSETITDETDWESGTSMTHGERAFYDVLQEIFNDSKTVAFSIVDYNDVVSNSILIGDNGTASNSSTPGVHTIDIGDIMQIGYFGIITAQGALAHELEEGYQIQATGMGPSEAHMNWGVQTENLVNGTLSLGAQTMSTVGIFTTIQNPVVVNGIMFFVTYNFVLGNTTPGGIKIR